MAVRSYRAFLTGALVAALAAGSFAGASAQAAPKSADSGTSSISLAGSGTATAWSTALAGTSVHYGDAVSFDTSVGIRVGRSTTVFIRLGCFQGSNPVYWVDGRLDSTFVLADTGTGRWDGGAATCSADLIAATASSNRVSYATLATTSFDVAAAA
jgi:hypothetical protein